MRLGLRWRDADLDQKLLQVRHTLFRDKEGLKLAEPKTLQSRRRISLTPNAIDALTRHRSREATTRLKLGNLWDDHDLVFANEIGRPVEASNFIRRSFLPLLDKANLDRICFHDLRHICATLLLRQGVHVKAVSELLGHASVTITLEIYSHVLLDMQEQAVKALEGNGLYPSFLTILGESLSNSVEV